MASLPPVEADKLTSALGARRDDLTPTRRAFDPAPPSPPWYDRFLNRNAKAIMALAIGGFTWWGTVIGGPAAITALEWKALGGIVLSALGVYTVTNRPSS